MTTRRSRDPERGERAGHDRTHGDARDQGEARSHPSYLALDRVALGQESDEVGRHVAGCPRCREHVARIAHAPPLPASPALRREARPIPRRPIPSRAWLAGLTAAATAAAVLLYFLLFAPTGSDHTRPDRLAAVDPPGGYDTAKGGRAVGVYVRRGRHTFLWNGSEAVEPGDVIRLKLVPDGMVQVHVFSEARGGGGAASLSLLHRAGIAPDRDILLETAWRIDGVGDREILVVVLARRPLSATAALAAARQAGMGDQVWVARLVLPKRPAGDSSAGNLDLAPSRLEQKVTP